MIRPQRQFEHFNLRRYFSVFSIVIIVILTLVLSYLVFRNQKQVLVDYSISSAEIFAHQLNNQIYNNIIDKTSGEFDGLTFGKDTWQYEDLKGIVEHYLEDYSDVAKLRIFDRSGKPVFSTWQEDLADTVPGELRQALDGNAGSRLIKSLGVAQGIAEEKGKFYQIDLHEIYVPLYRDISHPAESDIDGAFAIYRDVTPLFNLLRSNFYKIPLILILSMGTLYLTLQVVIKKADDIIQKKNEEIDEHNAELEEANKVIKASIDEVIEHESFHVRYESNKLLKCWEHKNCGQTECPSYDSEDLRCWQIGGTFCGGKVQGLFANKYGDCRKCEVYRYAFKDRINMIGESFNNMMTLLQNKHMQLQELNEKLNVLIDIDPLTGIGNRRSFQKRIESIHLLSLRYGRPYCIIMYDVDNFKLYNDTYGHQKGDFVLVSITNALKTSLRKTDEMFRWGGEEFVVILPEQGLADALKVAENLRAVAEALGIEHKNNKPDVVTVSLGVSSNANKQVSWEVIVKQADNALYRAKQSGKNCVFSSVDSDYKM